jgi:alpha-galactosidase
LLEKTGYFPYPGPRHVAEFLPYYYNAFNHEKKNQCRYWNFPSIRDVSWINMERHLAYAFFRLMALGAFPVPGPRKEGEWAMEMTLDWRRDSPTEYVVNIPNNGTVAGLPDNCIIEVPGYFKSGQILPLKTVNLPKKLIEYLRPHCEQQSLTVKAALASDPDLVVKAMLHDPMNKWIEDDDRIEYLTKLMLCYEQDWLPKAWKSWIPRREELKKSKYWISPIELSMSGIAFVGKKFLPREELRKKAFFWQC